jgi:hypothetical protein
MTRTTRLHREKVIPGKTPISPPTVSSCRPPSPPTAPVRYRGRFRRGRVPHWCGTIANGPISPPTMVRHDSHGQSVSFASGQCRALRARYFPLAFGVFPSSGVSPPPGVPTTFGRSPLPWCTRPVPSRCTFCAGRSQRLAPPAVVPPSVAYLGGSEHPRPPGCGPAQPGLNRVPCGRPELRPIRSPGSGTRIRDSAYGAPDVAALALPFSQPTVFLLPVDSGLTVKSEKE